MSSIWSRLINLAGNITGTLGISNGGTGQTTKAAAFDALSPMSTAGAVIYGGTAGTGTSLVAGSSTQLLHGGTTPSWSAASLTADVTGVLPIANGGSNKALTLAAGALVWTDADSFEVSAAGTTSDWALSGGTATPTFSSTTTTAKLIDGSADAIQLTVQGNATQTSDIFVVEKSDGTDLLEVTNTAGTKIRGDTTGATPATGFLGEVLTDIVTAAATLSTATAANAASKSFTAGTWLMWCGAEIAGMTANTSNSQAIVSLSATSATLDNTRGRSCTLTMDSTGDIANFVDVIIGTPPVVITLAATTTYYCIARATFSAGTVTATGFITGVRIF